ncbi:MAG: alginate lyase family protein [Cyclobacteriaceae bacterium]
MEFDELIGSHYLVLLRNVEYHLRANHLLENACSLVVGSFYFRNKQLYAKGSRLLVAQLNEQIFKDGGHYERSPMYHMIILHRLLDIVNVLLGNKIFDSQEDLLQILKVKTGRMLSWAKNMSCNNCLPAFHDSTNTEKVNIPLVEAYARRLKIEMPVISLEDSNYRKYKTNDLSLVMDIGSANPSFQPGHYHAGIFNFVLYVKDIPCIVDIGVSTYENNERRQYERSTMAHNTITINRVNQSEVWDSFRVGRRAKVYIEKDIKDSLMATHDGYDDIGKRHRITLNNLKDLISMKHELISTGNRYSVTTNEMRLHFHPTINPKLLHSGIVVDGLFSFEFVNASYVLENYSFAEDFNVLCEAKVLVITFVDWWELIIRS